MPIKYKTHSVTFPSPLEILVLGNILSIASYSKTNIIIKCTKLFFFKGSENQNSEHS